MERCRPHKQANKACSINGQEGLDSLPSISKARVDGMVAAVLASDLYKSGAGYFFAGLVGSIHHTPPSLCAGAAGPESRVSISVFFLPAHAASPAPLYLIGRPFGHHAAGSIDRLCWFGSNDLFLTVAIFLGCW